MKREKVIKRTMENQCWHWYWNCGREGEGERLYPTRELLYFVHTQNNNKAAVAANTKSVKSKATIKDTVVGRHGSIYRRKKRHIARYETTSHMACLSFIHIARLQISPLSPLSLSLSLSLSLFYHFHLFLPLILCLFFWFATNLSLFSWFVVVDFSLVWNASPKINNQVWLKQTKRNITLWNSWYSGWNAH